MALAAQQAVAEIENTYMMFSLGRYHFCAPVAPVQSIILMPTIRTLPMAPKGVMGTFLFREKAALACDLADVLNIQHQGEVDGHQLIVVSLPQGLIAFHVDHVADIVSRAEIEGKISTDGSSQEWLDGYVNLEQENKIAFLTRFEKLYAFLTGSMDAQNVAHWLTQQKTEGQPHSAAEVPPNTGDVIAAPMESEVLTPPETLDIENLSQPEPPTAPLTDATVADAEQSFEENSVDETNESLQDQGIASNQSQVIALDEEFSSAQSLHVSSTVNEVEISQEEPSDAKTDAVAGDPSADHANSTATLPSQAGASSRQQAYLREEVERRSEPSNSKRPTTPATDVVLPLGGEIVGAKPDMDLTPKDHDTRPLSRKTPDQTSYTPKIVMGVGLLAVVLIIAGVSYQWISAAPGHAKNSTQIPHVPTQTPIANAGNSAAKSAMPAKPSVVDSKTGAGASAPSSVIVDVVGKDYALRVERPAVQDSSVKSQPARPAPAVVAVPKPVVTAPAFAKEITHTVAAGDTLWNIAKKYLGDPYRYPELAKLSRINDPNLIFPGDMVRIQTERKVQTN